MMVRATTVMVMVRMATDGRGGDSDYMVMTMVVVVETMVSPFVTEHLDSKYCSK